MLGAAILGTPHIFLQVVAHVVWCAKPRYCYKTLSSYIVTSTQLTSETLTANSSTLRHPTLEKLCFCFPSNLGSKNLSPNDLFGHVCYIGQTKSGMAFFSPAKTRKNTNLTVEDGSLKAYQLNERIWSLKKGRAESVENISEPTIDFQGMLVSFMMYNMEHLAYPP